MVTVDSLMGAVDAAFAETGRGLAPWADPHPDRSPLEEEYSRVSDPYRWRIVGARAQAWLAALAGAGLADVEGDAAVVWDATPPTAVTGVDRAWPRAAGAIPLVVARSRLAAADDGGLTLGAGDPAVVLAIVPDCGCDACDSGSQDAIDEVDEYVLGVVTGAYRRLWRGDRHVSEMAGRRWASNVGGRSEMDRVLARPEGWNQLSGASWLGHEPGAGGADGHPPSPGGAKAPGAT